MTKTLFVERGLVSVFLGGAALSAVGFAGFINVDGAFCLPYCLGSVWQVFQPGDFEQSAAFATSNSSVCCGGVEAPGVAALRAFGDNLH
jgi:hypothetical protein